jgi:serine phosphatase RsbU (regulator of sigma subunit)
MSSIETIRKLFEKSDDAFFIIKNETLVKCNKKAQEILKNADFKSNTKFSLTRFSPELQPGGTPSTEKEKEITKIANKKGFHRFEWVLKDSKNEEFFVEVTIYCGEDEEKSLVYIILRDINQEKKDKLLMEYEIIQKNEEIETQRDLAETQWDRISAQKNELTDSITYASRIQSALLPESGYFSKIFSDYFILNKPKDIVSGDFYWLSIKGDKTIVAVADCTGHGVPGAFMSMLGVEFLNEIVNNLGIVQPNKILNNIRDRIIKSMGQTGKSGESMDGMDIALVSIDLENNSLQYAGAFNPLFIIRNNNLSEINGDRMPLGFHLKIDKPFTNHEIEIKANDSIYLFSDGYKDQFGWRNKNK